MSGAREVGSVNRTTTQIAVYVDQRPGEGSRDETGSTTYRGDVCGIAARCQHIVNIDCLHSNATCSAAVQVRGHRSIYIHTDRGTYRDRHSDTNMQINARHANAVG